MKNDKNNAYKQSLKVQLEGLDWAWREFSKHAYTEMFQGDAGMSRYESKRLDYIDERLRIEKMIEKIDGKED